MTQITVTLTPDTSLTVGAVAPDHPIIVTFAPFLGLGGGSGDLNYTHLQPQAADVWVVNHGLGKFPSVTVIDSAGSEIEGDYVYSNANTVVLNFSAAFSGVAYLN